MLMRKRLSDAWRFKPSDSCLLLAKAGKQGSSRYERRFQVTFPPLGAVLVISVSDNCVVQLSSKRTLHVVDDSTLKVGRHLSFKQIEPKAERV